MPRQGSEVLLEVLSQGAVVPPTKSISAPQCTWEVHGPSAPRDGVDATFYVLFTLMEPMAVSFPLGVPFVLVLIVVRFAATVGPRWPTGLEICFIFFHLNSLDNRS